MTLWSGRLDPDEFHLLGGEPTIHPEFPAFIGLVRRHWPLTHIRIRTNGFFLHRHPDLPALLAADDRAQLCLSVHHGSPEYRKRLRPTFDLIAAWERDHGISVQILESHSSWSRRYHGSGASMLPFEDGSPRASWDNCQARDCKQLFEGKIWKCAPLAYLGMQKAKYALSNKWDSYLRYKPLEPSCSDRELDAFISREDESFCGMCSAKHRSLPLPMPIRRSGASMSAASP